MLMAEKKECTIADICPKKGSDPACKDNDIKCKEDRGQQDQED
jgi:hypothetical protein